MNEEKPKILIFGSLGIKNVMLQVMLNSLNHSFNVISIDNEKDKEKEKKLIDEILNEKKLPFLQFNDVKEKKDINTFLFSNDEIKAEHKKQLAIKNSSVKNNHRSFVNNQRKKIKKRF